MMETYRRVSLDIGQKGLAQFSIKADFLEKFLSSPEIQKGIKDCSEIITSTFSSLIIESISNHKEKEFLRRHISRSGELSFKFPEAMSCCMIISRSMTMLPPRNISKETCLKEAKTFIEFCRPLVKKKEELIDQNVPLGECTDMLIDILFFEEKGTHSDQVYADISGLVNSQSGLEKLSEEELDLVLEFIILFFS